MVLPRVDALTDITTKRSDAHQAHDAARRFSVLAVVVAIIVRHRGRDPSRLR
jgi:hypothetical protein